MEEKNELNDIILSKSGSNSNSKKLLLAIAALTLILIIVLVIMNSLKTQSDEQPPLAAVPPQPTSPTEIIDDPLFEPVEVIQEGAGNVTNADATQDLGQIAQKIKEESFQNTPVQENVVQSAPATVVKSAPVPVAAAPAPKIVSKPVAAPVKVQTAPKVAQPVVNTPTIKTVKPTEVKKVAEAKKAVAVTAKPVTETVQKAAETPTKSAVADTTAPKAAAKAAEPMGTYYIQVGSFTKEPSKTLFDRLNASGLKYTTVPAGAATKVMVGPFQGEKAARDVLGTVKRNVEAGAYITKG
ncbi:MAG: SPOR domain-containing protein [Sulfuricurvum sp.]|uniref:SPOR domain-containing protein n=1 Tax=Sulfuricurvum sp. TaxID=2025608 RepID=UPI0027345DA5|nr:SPOR domain-containing protein [Sulfuricurvum sp.]MDP2850479.1 SPOR domain-containing protein [Sulfuricurvum sp.]